MKNDDIHNGRGGVRPAWASEEVWATRTFRDDGSLATVTMEGVEYHTNPTECGQTHWYGHTYECYSAPFCSCKREDGSPYYIPAPLTPEQEAMEPYEIDPDRDVWEQIGEMIDEHMAEEDA